MTSHAPRRRFLRFAIGLLVVIVVFATADLLLVRSYQKIHVSYEITRITGPKLPDGSIDYLRAMYAVGAAPYFDALAVHTYGFTSPPDDPPSPDKLNFRRFELLYAVMKQNGDAAKPIIARWAPQLILTSSSSELPAQPSRSRNPARANVPA